MKASVFAWIRGYCAEQGLGRLDMALMALPVVGACLVLIMPLAGMSDHLRQFVGQATVLTCEALPFFVFCLMPAAALTNLAIEQFIAVHLVILTVTVLLMLRWSWRLMRQAEPIATRKQSLYSLILLFALLAFFYSGFLGMRFVSFAGFGVIIWTALGVILTNALHVFLANVIGMIRKMPRPG